LVTTAQYYDTVRLNAKNNWRHTWKSLPKYHADGSAIEWRVTEQPLKRYTVRISRDGNTFLVVNTYNPQSPDEDSTTRTVIKRWDDAGYEQKRPDTITVTLLKDGTVYDTRTISRTDSWQYTWSGLPRYNPDGTEIVWTIQENAVPGYISSIRETGDTFILTNTPEHQKLPQTGLLWWPVPVLAAAGLLLLILGTLLKRKNDHD
jgi:putative collagen-binding protein